ncbi:CZB domain-containing protein [Pleionea sp. CnH1-48]|uniref:CZB domain-containing protein n=1 Tax=Pleionea sp. CnH1-48 TaxID=2954494 RepID=UPI002097B713|nr:CZB domain-containing protein [Pleionea sp. CnH1-48]MCO7225277.1 CZB domain-containing protein [Pleionea sp. CnH1-48]
MSTYDEISKAIAAHGQWKNKLRNAIDTGKCESTPAKVKQDNNCSFGKWLHGRIDPQAKSSSYYSTVVNLHADFHKEAGSILEVALSGDKNSASQRIGLGSEFSRLSAELTKTMKAWQDSL